MKKTLKKVLFVSSQCNSHQIKFTVLKKALTGNFNMNFEYSNYSLLTFVYGFDSNHTTIILEGSMLRTWHDII